MSREMARETDETADIRRRARPWRRLTVLGGALLATSFFLPAVASCNSNIVPARDLAQAICSAASQPQTSSLADLVLWSPMLLTAYLLGLLLALAALARLTARTAWNRRLARFALICLLLTAADAAFLFILRANDSSNSWSWPWVSWPEWQWVVPCLVGPLVTLVYLAAAWRPAHRLQHCAAFLMSAWMCCWFGFWVTLPEGLYGLCISLAGAGLLLLATIGEARAVTRQSWLRTIGQLLIGRLAAPASLIGHCPECDYLLYGLTEKRCPECGRGFTPDEVGFTFPENNSAIPVDDPRRPI